MRRDPAHAAARGLHWGSPVRDSGITLIHDGRLYYRGQDAVRLAETASLEDVAAILWAAEAGERPRLFEQPAAVSLRQLAPLRALAQDPLTALQAALPIAAAVDTAAYDLRPAAVRQTGARIVRLFAQIVGRRDSTAPLHQALQTAWRSSGSAAGHAIRAALVLCADHELNVSAFAARCAASAGASPYDVVSAALATFKGYKHGGAAERVLALLAEIDTPSRTRAVIAGRLRRGELVPGFGHPLYPGRRSPGRAAPAAGGDQRQRGGMAADSWRVAVGRDAVAGFPEPGFRAGGAGANLSTARPRPALLFALGRTIGWIAHALEEYASGQLIRPRARYTGPPPDANRARATVPRLSVVLRT